MILGCMIDSISDLTVAGNCPFKYSYHFTLCKSLKQTCSGLHLKTQNFIELFSNVTAEEFDFKMYKARINKLMNVEISSAKPG